MRAPGDDQIPWAFRQPLVVRTTLRRWRETLGMVFAVGLALGMVMTIQAMVSGSVWLYVGDYVVSGVDLYVLQRGGTLIPLLPGEGTGALDEARHRLAQTRAMPEVRQALGVATWGLSRTSDIPRRHAPTERIITVGVDGDATAIANAVDLRSGRWLRRDDEVVVGYKLARQKRLAVGDDLILERRHLKIVGIGQLRGVGMAASGSAFVTRQTLRDLSSLGDRVSYLLVDTDAPAAARAHLQAELRSVDVWDRTRVTGALDEVISRGMVIWQLIGGLAMFVAAVFVSSMLLRSVAERRDEFATLRAIGVPARTLAALVLGDAVLVAVLATLAGIAISYVLGLAFDRVLAESLNLEPMFRAEPSTFATTFLLALGVGVLAAALPTRNVLRVEPAEVLREA